MNKIIPALSLALLAFFSSCVVVSTKKYQAMIAAQDSLSGGWNTAKVKIISLEEELGSLRSDTAGLNERIRQLRQQLNEAGSSLSSTRSSLNDLKSSTSSEIARLAADLKKREARISEVEEILRKRDAATNALRDKLQKALLGFKQSGLSVDIRDGKVYVSLTDKLLFASGSIVIDEKGKQALKELATVLKTQPEINISVEGHTDDQKINNLGQIKDNWDLSVLRATSVVRYLTDEQKIDNARITATGKGQYQPVDRGSTPEARSLNRRIEIVLSPKLEELYQLIK